jgi:hypothetical protein
VNKHQKVAIGIAAINALLLVLFPPFDQRSIATAAVPAFAGFYFALSPPPYGEVNAPLLTLEILVVLINAGIAWLFLGDKVGTPRAAKPDLRSAVLVATGANLVVMALFPPFQSIHAISNAALPSLEGFYFLFSHPANHAVVTSLLYVEVAFILANGALFWLLLGQRPDAPARGRENSASG